MEATVRGDELLSLRPDPDHPNTRGFTCSKGLAFGAVRDDPDRLLHPLKRRPDGSFEQVSWDQALDEIGQKLRSVIAEHGTESIGLYQGNSVAWNFRSKLPKLDVRFGLQPTLDRSDAPSRHTDGLHHDRSAIFSLSP